MDNIDMDTRIRVARGFLGPDAEFDQPWGGFARCPHSDLHGGGKSVARECRVYLTGAPTIHCFHVSCQGALEATNKELRRAVWEAERGMAAAPRRRAIPRAPQPEKVCRDFDRTTADRLASNVPDQWASEDWWRSISPVDVDTVTAEGFLDALFQPGDRVMVTTAKRSTGDFIYVAGEPGKAYRLGKRAGVKAVSAPRLPRAGSTGVYFMINPVNGQWTGTGFVDQDTKLEKLGRRTKRNLVRFPHMLLETDVLDAGTWCRILAQLPMPIAAIIHTGGRGLHALVRVEPEPPSLADWEWMAKQRMGLLAKLGADWQAMGAINSSRLPWCRRCPESRDDWGGDLSFHPLQRLIYLDPNPTSTPIFQRERTKQRLQQAGPAARAGEAIAAIPGGEPEGAGQPDDAGRAE